MLPLILIGGSARMGKTTTAHKLATQHSLFSLSVDCVTAAMRNFYIDAKFPSQNNSSWSDPDKFVENMRKRDEIAWSFTKYYIENSGRKGNSLLVEGMLWPDMIERDLWRFKLNNLYSIPLFIVDTSDNAKAFDSLKSIEDKYDWINRYEDEKILEFVFCNKRRSEVIKEMCIEYNFDVYDLKDLSKEECQLAIIRDVEKLLQQ